ncbi:hypothetical protein SUDANB58_04350 [Streptomyces sp. enrichment culture]
MKPISWSPPTMSLRSRIQVTLRISVAHPASIGPGLPVKERTRDTYTMCRQWSVTCITTVAGFAGFFVRGTKLRARWPAKLFQPP